MPSLNETVPVKNLPDTLTEPVCFLTGVREGNRGRKG